MHALIHLIGSQQKIGFERKAVPTSLSRRLKHEAHKSGINIFHVMPNGCASALFQILFVEPHDLIERYLLQVVIKIGMACAGHDEEFLVVAFKFLEGVLAHVS